MPSKDDLDDDEYVAKLLAEDAKKSSLKYSTQGMQALLPRRATTAAPKPNTRFLKSIVREADSHNAALKKKEELEAHMRLRRTQEQRLETASNGRAEDDRPSKKRRLDDDEDNRSRRYHRHRSDHDRRDRSPNRSRSPERSHHRSSRDFEGRHSRKERQGFSHRSSERDLGDGIRSGGLDRHHSDPDRHRKRRRSRFQDSPPSEDRTQRNGRRDRREKTQPPKSDFDFDRRKTAADSPSPSYESDPLESLVGPLDRPAKTNAVDDPPPVRSKGRGAHKPPGAAMDAHFSTGYNPTMDLHPESEVEDEKEDWDMALEALRDREMFKQKHAERLREAGFGDAEIKKWEDSGKEKDIDEVRWSSKGQAREWDVGKIAPDDLPEPEKQTGSELDAAWKRKNGGFLKSFKRALG